MDEREAFIGIHEAAEITSYHPKYLGQLCRDGKCPHHQTGPNADLRFLVSELRAWLRGEWKPDHAKTS